MRSNANPKSRRGSARNGAWDTECFAMGGFDSCCCISMQDFCSYDNTIVTFFLRDERHGRHTGARGIFVEPDVNASRGRGVRARVGGDRGVETMKEYRGFGRWLIELLLPASAPSLETLAPDKARLLAELVDAERFGRLRRGDRLSAVLDLFSVLTGESVIFSSGPKCVRINLQPLPCQLRKAEDRRKGVLRQLQPTAADPHLSRHLHQRLCTSAHDRNDAYSP